MKYKIGNTGRIFVVRFDHGEDMIESLTDLSKKEKIHNATITFLGALEEGVIVAGPVNTGLPAEPNYLKFNGGWESVGFGFIVRGKEDDVKVHIHGTLGRKEKTCAGCFRSKIKIFVTIEAIVTEIVDINVVKETDKETGCSKMVFEDFKK